MLALARLTVIVLGLAVLSSSAATARAKKDNVKVTEVVAFETRKLPKPFYGSNTKWFDLSPDGRTLAVLLETHQGSDDSGKSIWLVLWDVNTRQVERSKRLEGPDPESRNHAQYGFRVRFVPIIGRILVLTGSRLLSLHRQSLEIAFAFDSPAMPGKLMESRLIKHFSVSEDGSRLVVEYWQGWPQREVEIEIADAIEGRILFTRKVAGPAYAVLSPDGGRIVITQNRFDKKGFLRARPNVFLQDVKTQATLMELAIGVLTADVQFLSPNLILTIAGGPHDPIVYSKDRIKVWDLSTGKIIREFEYGKYGVRGAMDFSKSGQLLAAVVHWSSKWNARLDTSIFPSWTRLVIWDLQTGKRIWVSRNGPTDPAVTHWRQVRLSEDATRMAVGSDDHGFGHQIWIYCIER